MILLSRVPRYTSTTTGGRTRPIRLRSADGGRLAGLAGIVGGVIVLNALASVVGYNAAWLAFGGPLDLAWIVLGRSLLDGESARTTTIARDPPHDRFLFRSDIS
ncbi:hypothetical protein ACFQE8_05090 [Salinirubellus sp. GCM10025818]|uniref:hypothetical protein n=1 Tax=unclassified Salinirubellus TaxID=2627207 RepID=UPI003623DBBB